MRGIHTCQTHIRVLLNRRGNTSGKHAHLVDIQAFFHRVASGEEKTDETARRCARNQVHVSVQECGILPRDSREYDERHDTPNTTTIQTQDTECVVGCVTGGAPRVGFVPNSPETVPPHFTEQIINFLAEPGMHRHCEWTTYRNSLGILAGGPCNACRTGLAGVSLGLHRHGTKRVNMRNSTFHGVVTRVPTPETQRQEYV